MRSRWVFLNLSHHQPSCLSSLCSPFTLPPYPGTSRFALNDADISRLLSICGREGRFHLGSSLHASFIKEFKFSDADNPVGFRHALTVWNSLLFMYSKCGQLPDAAKLFDEMPVKDTVSWNSVISGFLSSGKFAIGWEYFRKLCDSNLFKLDQATLTTVLSASDERVRSRMNEMIHALVFLNGYDRELSVGNALITSYFKHGQCNLARRVFAEMLERNVITWTTMISGLAQNQFYEDSLKLFIKMRHGLIEPNSLTYLTSLSACSGLRGLKEGKQIHGVTWKLGIQSDLCIETALMDMYSKCGCLSDAMEIFEAAGMVDEVSMTVILAGFAQNGCEEEAIHFFIKMVKEGIKVDASVVSAVLSVFGVDTSLALGKQIHALTVKNNFCSNPFISNGLITMYSKCGDLKNSIEVFQQMPQKNSISWNSMIAALARHGESSRALQFYEYMKLEGVEPTDVTFLSLLHACSHAGLVDKGMEFLEAMYRVYGICPRMEHYACVVDMLGRKGLIKEAKNFIEELPIKPDIFIWQALLGACGIHGDTDVGKYAADNLILEAPDSPATYILMANIYSSKGQWKARAETIKRMKEMGVSKETGISWIEIEREIHSFVVGDRMHQQEEIIRSLLLQLFKHMSDEGYVPDKFIRYYLNQDEEASNVTALG
ncbi:hypothetical protein NMG60_11020740 [Bertholletia excelsa]